MADTTTPNPEEFSKMQEEALERLREMQRRSRSMVAGTQSGDGTGASLNGSMSGSGASRGGSMSGNAHGSMSGNTTGNAHGNTGFPNIGGQSRNQPSHHPAGQDQSTNHPTGQPLPIASLPGLSGASVSGIIKSLLGEAGKLDTDSLLILLMLFALYKNKADIKLLAAMGYILL